MQRRSKALDKVRARRVTVTKHTLIVTLDDGREISTPIEWFPRLAHGTPRERGNWELIGDGEGIHWPDLDEDIEVAQLLVGWQAGESEASLKRWLEARKARKAS
jgi:hypothetical protein